ncbi:MAG: serine/threonine protein kinase [Lachnospiraceae bacterium]|nr:serine/threonine protein kinase [Lachnospiraceae bacterium]
MNYKKIRKIGNLGGYGQVYECIDENNNVYAMKKLKKLNDFSIPRFDREVRLMKRLNHPNVIKVIAYNLEMKAFIMPKYKCSLQEIIPELYSNYERQYTIINSILAGVEYLHSEGVYHRDLKPANILYNSDSDIVIADLGLGIQVNSESATLTKSNIFGTDRYCSPEQWQDSHNVDQRTDIYALGMILEDIVSNFNKYDDYDDGIRFIIEKCTKRNKENRFSNLLDLRKSIENVYNALLDEGRLNDLDQEIIKLASGDYSDMDIVSLALQLNNENDMEYLEKFFENISANKYKIFENNNKELAEKLVERLCEYWNKSIWPFSYIDSITVVIDKLFFASTNAEIKAKLLYELMDLAIDYNRWNAMDKVKLLLNDIKTNKSVLLALELLLRDNLLNLSRITSIKNLPSSIRKIYDEKDEEIFYF